MRFPVQTSLPGLAGVSVEIDADGRGRFTDRSGNMRHIEASGNFGEEDSFLTIFVDGEPMCSFHPFPNYPAFWMASGLVVNTGRQGIASAIYAYVRDVLASQGRQIAPSETVKDDGVAFWAYIDHNVKWEWLPELGCSRPDLTGLQAP
jgi:hypothetical protein